MNSLAVTIERWAAWAPGVETPSQWQMWAKGELEISGTGLPDVNFLSAMFRRRLSRLSRMALRVIWDCLGEDHKQIQTVFCSRHGELQRTAELLNSIIAADALSPTAFSMSVHNTASGLHSIAHKDKSPSSAIASGIDTLESGFMNAAAVLHAGDESKIALVIADDSPPEPFDPMTGENEPAYAAAFLLSKGPKPGRRISLGFEEGTSCDTGDSPGIPHALSLLKLLLNNERELTLKTARLAWVWRNHDGQN